MPSLALLAYLGAWSVSLLGDRFAELALPVVVLAATRDPAAAGAVGASMQAPAFVFALWLGVRVDQRSRRGLMLAADLVRAACFAGFAALAAGHASAVWPYVAVGLVVGCGNVLFAIAGSAILPELVRGSRLVRANAMLEAGDAVTTVAGPAAAGSVVARFGAAVALVLDAVTFLVSAMLLLAVRRPPSPGRTRVATARHRPARAGPARAEPLDPDPAGGPADPGAPGGVAGWGGVWRPLLAVVTDATQRRVQVALTALSAHGAAVVLAIVVLGQSELGLSTARVGLVLAAAGVGGLLASAVATRWPEPFGTLRGIAWALLLGGGFVALLALAGGFWWALAGNALADAAVTAGFIATASVRQQRTPMALLGRVAAGSTVCNAAARVLGAGGVGLLLAWQGARATLLVDAAVLVAAAAVAVRREPAPSPS